MKPLNLCMVTTFYPPYSFGGDGVFVYRLANALARDGHTVHVIHDVDAFRLLGGHPPTAPYPSHPNITLHPLSRGGAGKLDLLLTHQLGRPALKRTALKSLLEQSTFDVIHFHNISLLGGPGVLAYGTAMKLCTLHEYWFVCPMHVLWRFDREACTQRTCLRCTLAGHRPPQLWRATGNMARAVSHVDAFIAPSEFTRDMYVAQGFPVRAHHIPHFVPDIEMQATADDASEVHARPYFLYVGRLERLKGIHTLIERFRTYRTADLLIVGTGSCEAELRELARDLPHVHFRGAISHDRLQALYRNALAAVVPSLCYETFGLVPIEAFAAQTPAIVSAMGALPEVVQAGGGLVYQTDEELLEAMETLRTQPELRARLAQQGHQSYRERYTEERHLARYYTLIDDVQRRRRARTDSPHTTDHEGAIQ